jgi:serine/threonine protein kinase
MTSAFSDDSSLLSSLPPRPQSFQPIVLDLPDADIDISFAEFDFANHSPTASSKPQATKPKKENPTTTSTNEKSNSKHTSSSQALPIQTFPTQLTIHSTSHYTPGSTSHRPTSPLLTIPHTLYPEGLIPPYTHIRQLGYGSLGTVDEVSLSLHHPLHSTSKHLTLARKSVRLSPSSKDYILPIIRQEILALHTLRHRHIVQLIATYESKPFYSLLMTPVGDRNLKDFLEEFPLPSPNATQQHPQNQKSSPDVHEMRKWLLTWFPCLTSTLSYVHSQGIRHEDIKPSNIIHRGANIYLTDFSSCTSFEQGMTTSTETPAGRITRVYSAPEVLDATEMDGRARLAGVGGGRRHGVGADVFSLGCVFAEMATVGLLGRKVSDLWHYVGIERAGVLEREARYYCRGTGRVDGWFARTSSSYSSSPSVEPEYECGRSGDGVGDGKGKGEGNAFYEKCIKPMLALNRKERPKAGVVAGRMRDWFRELEGCGECECMERSEEREGLEEPSRSDCDDTTGNDHAKEDGEPGMHTSIRNGEDLEVMVEEEKEVIIATAENEGEDVGVEVMEVGLWPGWYGP